MYAVIFQIYFSKFYICVFPKFTYAVIFQIYVRRACYVYKLHLTPNSNYIAPKFFLARL